MEDFGRFKEKEKKKLTKKGQKHFKSLLSEHREASLVLFIGLISLKEFLMLGDLRNFWQNIHPCLQEKINDLAQLQTAALTLSTPLVSS